MGMLFLLLFVGCSSGGGTDTGGGDFVFTGGGSGGGTTAPGALTFNFVKAQSPFTVPTDTTQIRFQFYAGSVQVQQEIRDFAATITIDPVDARTTSVVITALGDGGFPIATATVPVRVVSGDVVVVDATGVTITPVTLDDLQVTPPQATLAVNETLQLTATLQFSNGEQLPADNVTWSATGQATVSATGLVTGTEDGAAVVTATRDTLTGTCNIVVGAGLFLDSVEIQPNVTPVVQTGVGLLQFTVSGFDQFNNPIAITTPVTWEITVNNSGSSIDTDGLFTGGPTEGVDTVQVTVNGKTDTQTVNVIDIPGDITGIVTTPDPVNLTAPNQTLALTTTASFQNGPDAPINNAQHGLSYSSDNTAVATVGAANGIVTAIAQGSTTVNSMANGQMDTVTVNVDFGAANAAPQIANLGNVLDLGPTPKIAFGTVTVTDNDQLDFNGGTLIISASGTANDILFDVDENTTIGSVVGDGMSTVTVALDADATPASVQAFLQTVTAQSNMIAGGASMDISLADGRPTERTGTGSRSASIVGFTEGTDSPYTVGGFPYGVALADFDGMNGLDVVATAGSSDLVRVFLNDGDGTFTESSDSPYASTTGPRGVVTGDFDGGNGIDFALCNANGGGVRVFLNDNDGTFTESTASPYGGFSTPQEIATGDIDGQNGLDLVIGGQFGASVMLNNGDGTFSAPVQITGSICLGVAVADVDGTSGPDLVLSIQNFSNRLLVLLNDGSGGFTPAAGSPYVSDAYQIAVGDLDGVNGLDIAVSSFSNNLEVFLNNGNGTFIQANGSPYPLGSFPDKVALADFDGRRGLDVAVTRSDGTVAVFANQGDGTFVQGAGPFSVGGGPRGIAVGDLDGVRGPDIVVASGGGFTVLLNDYLP